MSGWIKVSREILEWEWYDHPPTKVLFLHLLLKANYKPTRYRGHDVPAGSLVAGVNSLAEKTGLTVSQVRTALRNLKRQEIAIKTTNKFSIISILKWSQYQADDNQTANKSQTDDTQIATSKEIKNKKINNIPPIAPQGVSNELWEEFKKHRVRLKSPMTEKAEKLLADKLKKLQAKGHDPTELLETAIERGWKSVFEPKENQKAGAGISDAAKYYKLSKEKKEGQFMMKKDLDFMKDYESRA